MSLNVVNLSGTVERINWQDVGQQANGRFNKYPRLSACITWPDVHMVVQGTQVTIGGQKAWIELSVPKNNGAQKAQGLVSHHQRGAQSFLLVNGTFSSWTGNQGVKFEVKASMGDFEIGHEALAGLNIAMIKGKVTSHQGPWLMIEERYRNPLEQDPNKAWKSRYIPVFCSQQFANLVDREVLVIGHVSVHTPTLQPDRSFRMTPYLHVYATEVHACLA